MTIKLPYPTMTSQTKDKDMVELKKYLFRLIEELNNDLNTLLTYTGVVDSSSTDTSTFVGVLNQAMNNLSLKLEAEITTNNKQVESEITDIQRNYVKSSDISMVDDLTTLSNLPSDWAESGTGRAVIYGNSSVDRYYILFSTTGGLWNGYKSASSDTITWYSIGETSTTTTE